MNASIKIRVDGIPAPQGSKTIAKAGTKVWLRDANATRLKPWRAKIAAAADVGHSFDCPVEVFAMFYMPRPLKVRWWAPAGRIGDIDKLCRALLDGLTDSGLIADDARVVDLHAYKRYASKENPVGVRVIVMEADEKGDERD